MIHNTALRNNFPVRVCITRPIPEPGPAILMERGLDVWVRERCVPPDEDELAGLAGEFQILITLLTDPVTERVLSSGIRMVAQMAGGYDNIDLPAATRHRVVVTNTPDALTESTAELTWALILAVARHIVIADQYTRQGRFKAWDATAFLGAELSGKSMGILGAGRIGTRVGEIACAFRMSLLYYDLVPSERLDSLGARHVSLTEVLREADVLSLHLPLTPETKALIGEKELRLMKPSAIIVNAARGSIVDEDALVKALKEGWIAGAGFDVYEKEPKVHPDLLGMSNVVLLPHIGSATREARSAMSRAVAENVLAFVEGRRPPNILNPEVL